MDEGREAAPGGQAEHLAPLTAGWSVWRQFGLRGAGFPAALAERVRQPESAGAADELLRRERELRARGLRAAARAAALAEERARYEALFEAEARGVSEALRELARNPALREAVAWQNRSALEGGFDALLRQPPGRRDRKVREKEELVAKYLVRYCLKNDTIGFFGPLGWGRVEPGVAGLVLEPGPGLVGRRQTYFEHWGIDVLAARLSADARLRPWFAPRRLPLVRIEGTRAVPPMGDPIELGAASARALALSDGERSALEIAAIVRAEPGLGAPSEGEVLGLLDEHVRQGRAVWALEIPNIEPHPERVLRRQLERVDDRALRAEALAPLDELEACRDALDRASGDAAAVARELDALDRAFSARTGERARRREGQTYAGRTLVYQDCARDVALALGPDLLRRLGPALGVLLDSARWFTAQVGARYLAAFERAFDELRAGAPAIDFLHFHLGVGGLFPFIAHRSGPYLKPELTLDIAAELQARWAKLLAIAPGERDVRRSSAGLAAAARELFDAPGPGWPNARYHAPDLMIAAASAEAVGRGEFVAVLGELHIALNTLESPALFFQHPRPGELAAALARDLPGPRVSPAVPKDRATRAAVVPFNDDAIEFVFDATRSWRPPAQVIAVGDLVVGRVGGRLEARTRDGAWRGHVLELYDYLLAVQFANELQIVPEAAHTPRVTIDDLVVCRETWRFASAELPFIWLHDAAARLLEARRWATRVGLPGRLFYKTTQERKPFFLDLASPTSLKAFVKMVRASERVSLSEMLPSHEQLWLHDAEGRAYTSELRLVAVDERPWRASGA